MMGKGNQVLSESKIAAALERAFSGRDKAIAVRSLLTSVAIGSNAELQAKVNGAMRPSATAGWSPEADGEADDWDGAAEDSDWGEG